MSSTRTPRTPAPPAVSERGPEGGGVDASRRAGIAAADIRQFLRRFLGSRFDIGLASEGQAARQEREERLTDSIREHELTQAALREEVQRLEAVNALGHRLAAEVDLQRLHKTVTDVAMEESGAAFGAFVQKVEGREGGAHLVYTLSGAPREALDEHGVLGETAPSADRAFPSWRIIGTPQRIRAFASRTTCPVSRCGYPVTPCR